MNLIKGGILTIALLLCYSTQSYCEYNFSFDDDDRVKKRSSLLSNHNENDEIASLNPFMVDYMASDLYVYDVMPMARCLPDVTVFADRQGCSAISVEDIDDGSDDNSAAVIVDMELDITELCCTDALSTTVTLTVTNDAGLMSTCTSNVMISDTFPPTIICNNNVVRELDSGLCGEFSLEQPLFVDDNCELASVMQTVGPDFFDITMGPTMVVFVATDISGNTSECSYTVEYIENQNPTTTLTCNDQVNTSANLDCDVVFTADMLLEGGSYRCYDSYVVSSEGLFNEEAFAEFKVTVTDPVTGNSCWGIVTVEDKSIPTIDCTLCPEGGLGDIDGDGVTDFDPECQLMCYELPLFEERFFSDLLEELIPGDPGDFAADFVDDNCEIFGAADVAVFDVINSNECDPSTLKRNFTLTFDQADGSIGRLSCVREYQFNVLDIDVALEARFVEVGGRLIPEVIEDTLILPKRVVEIPTCGIGTDPASIQAFFDNPMTSDEDTDDDDVIPAFVPDLVVENNEGTWFAYPHYYIDGRGGGSHAQAIDTEVCNLVVGYTDVQTSSCAVGCVGNSKTVRTWTIFDWCKSEFITYDQVIVVEDDISPVVTMDDIMVSVDPWKCSADILLPTPKQLIDNCDENLTYQVVVERGLQLSGDANTGFVIRDVPLGMTTVRLEAVDCCGNIGTDLVTITVTDDTPPVAITKEFVIAGLTNVGNPISGDENGVSKVFATSIDNGSYDSCSPVTIEVRRVNSPCGTEDLEWGEFVNFCCEDLGGQSTVSIDVQFRVTDLLGNSNISWTTVQLEDKSAPAIFCPAPMILTCDVDINDTSLLGTPELFGACGMIPFQDLTLVVEPRDKALLIPPLFPQGSPAAVPAYNPSCGFGAIRRQYREDGAIICEQWLVITPIDMFDSSTIEFPSDMIVDCDEFESGEPTWEESICNLVGVTLDSDTFRFQDEACYKVINRWSVIDWCTYDPTNPTGGGRYESVQVIQLIDTVDPVVSVQDSLCFGVNEQCGSKGVVLTGSASDNGDCASESISWVIEIDVNADWVIDYTYSTTVPQLVDGEPNLFYVPKSASEEEVRIILPDGIEGSKNYHRAIWTALDGCGNLDRETTYFQIADKKPPTPFCLNLGTAVMTNGQVELWAIDFNQKSFDNCSDENLLFTFTDVMPPPRCDAEYDNRADRVYYDGTFWYFDSEVIEDDPTDNECNISGFGEYMRQGDYGGSVHIWQPELRSSGKIFTAADGDANGFVQVPIYVWDECGNRDFCLVNLRLVDNAGGSSGRIAGAIRTEMGETVENVMTSLGGPVNLNKFEMTDLQGEFAFEDIPMFTDYRVSGEKNDDYLNGVSTLDIVLMQRHILGQEILSSPYKMIAADVNNDKNITALDLISLRKLILGIYDELPDNGSWKFIDGSQRLTTINPWLYKESRDILNLENDMLAEDFVGVKIGDLNNSITLGLASTEIDRRSSQSVEIKYDDRLVGSGDIVELILSTERDDLYGYQFTLESNGLELQSVSGKEITAGNVGVHSGKLTMSYSQVDAIEKGELVSMIFKSTVSGQLSDILSLSNSITRTEAYVGERLEEVSITLRSGEAETTNFELYQNEPNPFTSETVIGFELPKPGSATLSLYDVTGKVLKVIEGDYAQGYNEVVVTRGDLSANGMVYYKLQTEDHTASRHMIIIE